MKPRTLFLNAWVMICVLATTAGCSTMYFHNGSSKKTQFEIGEWHHDGIIRLVEFSSPVDMNDRCEGKGWQSIKVEKNFIQGLAGAVSYGMYDPWNVNYHCR